jgi:BlaI family penicillinase repressor
MPKPEGLSRRERQIMDALHRLGRAAPDQVREALPDPPTYTAVNTMLRILLNHGHVGRALGGRQYVYYPTQPRQSAARTALRQVVETFFGGSAERAMTTLLSEAETDLTDEELERLSAAIERAKDKEHRDGPSDAQNVSTEGEAR